MKLNDLFIFFILEFSLTVLISSVVMFLTYLFDGTRVVATLIIGQSSLTHWASLATFVILLILSLLLFTLKYVFNFNHKHRLAFLANQLFDYCLALLRIIGGLLIACSLVYLMFEGASAALNKFMFWGVLAILEVAIFSCLKNAHENPVARPIY